MRGRLVDELAAPVDVVGEGLVRERLGPLEPHLLAVLGAQRLIGHVPDGGLVGLGDAEEHADHAHRHLGADRLDEVEAVGPGERVQDGGAEPADPRFQHPDPARSEDAREQAAVDVVDGRVLEDEGARRDLVAQLDDLQDVSAGRGERPPVRQPALAVGEPGDRVEVVFLVVVERHLFPEPSVGRIRVLSDACVVGVPVDPAAGLHLSHLPESRG
ncbi:MAG TPA: hypothetical protein VFV01_06345 [Spirillospora sp.]|nr:hypothetical protein [Spirillospora sp.]